MKRLKKAVVYSLVALASFGASGSAVYFSMNATDKTNGGDVNNQGNDDNGSDDTVTPDLPNDNDEDNNFSKMVNNLINSKELEFQPLTVSVDTAEINPITLAFSDLQIDLTNSSSLDINLYTKLNVKYSGTGGGTIDETLEMNFESSGFVYVIYGSHKYCLSAPTTLASFMSLIKAVGVNIPDVSSALGSIDLNSIKDQALSVMDTVASSEVKNDKGGYNYTVTIPSFTVSGTTVSNLNLVISSNSDNNLCGIKTVTSTGADKGTISIGSASIGLTGTCSVLASSNYASVHSDDYQDLTNATSSIFTTVTSILKTKQTNVDLAVDLTNSKDSNLDTSVTGTMIADASSVEKDLTKGKYSLSLKHSDLSSNKDTLGIVYDGSATTTYLDLNDGQLKGKITNSDISSIFKSVSSLTGKSTTEGLTDELTNVLGKCAFTELLVGDVSNYKDFISSFTYTKDTNFTLVINAKAFGLGDYQISIIVNYDAKNTCLTSIQVKGLQYQDYTANITLTPTAFTAISIDSSKYSSLSPVVPIFNTVADIVKNKKAGASYSFIYKDTIGTADTTDDSSLITASGRIDADLSSVTDFTDALTAVSNGNYHLSLNATSNTTTVHKINLNYQNTNLYFGYNTSYTTSTDADNDGVSETSTANNTVFKNYISKANIGTMADVITTAGGTKTSSVSALTDMDSILEALQTSSAFQKDIKTLTEKGYVSQLSSFLKIEVDSSDASKINISLNIPYVFGKTALANKIGSITVCLDTDDSSLSEITVSNASLSSTKSLTFTMKFDTYNFNPSDPAILADTASYTQINKAAQLMQSFYNLNTDLTKFGIKVEADLKKEDNSTVIDISGDAAADLTKEASPSVYGVMNVKAPSISSSKTLANQKVEFDYQNDGELGGQFVAEYNDNMHVMMHTSTVSDIFTSVKTGYNSSSNVLFNYLKGLNNVANSMPLTDVIKSKDYTSLLDYPYINKVEIGDKAISLTVDGALFGSDHAGEEDTIEIGYEYDDDNTASSCHLTYASLAATYSGKKISAKISLVSYDSVTYSPTTVTGEAENSDHMVLYSDSTKNQFVDLDGLSTLTDCLIDTTENNYFGIEGNIKINAKALNYLTIDLISTYVKADIYVGDQQVYVYLSFNNGNKKITDANFLATEFCFSESSAYVVQTRNTTGASDNSGITSEAFKTTTKDLKNNIVYYLTDYVLDIDNMFAGKVALAYIYKGMSSSSSSSSLTSSIKISDDFSKIIKNATLDTSAQIFSLGLDLDSLLNINNVSFTNTSINLGYTTSASNKDYTPFYGLTLGVDVSAYDAVAAHCFVSLKLTGLGNYSSLETSPMSRYNSITSAMSTQTLTDYSITSIGDYTSTWYGVYNGYTVNDNASTAKLYFKTYDSASVYFYKN